MRCPVNCPCLLPSGYELRAPPGVAECDSTRTTYGIILSGLRSGAGWSTMSAKEVCSARIVRNTANLQ